MMNDNQTTGVGRTIEGAIKETAGKLTGNKLREVEGKVEKNVGKVQTRIGDKQEQMRHDPNRPPQ